MDFRDKIHEIIFGADTPAGIWFDVALLIAILISVVCVCLGTVESINEQWSNAFLRIEWMLTFLFTIEYIVRLYCVRKPLKYATSFFGMVDLLAVLPSYLPLFFPGYHTFAVVRALRLLRVFRILKMGWFVHESDDLARAVYQARAKIVVFAGVILIAITIAGSIMYEIENPESRRDAMKELNQISQIAIANGYSLDPDNESFDELAQLLKISRPRLEARVNQLAKSIRKPIEDVVAGDIVASEFSSIPQAMYWATVTMTTVGYGDIVPHTPAGKIVSAILILLGYSLIIVPTGFVSAEIIGKRKAVSNITCRYCMTSGHDADAVFCKYCGEKI
jgi:voltage-gated potassium channel